MEEIEKLCRICMADYEESTSLYTITDENKINETKAGNMFYSCLNLEVRFFFYYFFYIFTKNFFLFKILPNTGYPKEICNHCNLQISVFYNFMTMAKKSHDKFTIKLNAIKDSNAEETKFNQDLLNMLEEDDLSANVKTEIIISNSDNEEEEEESYMEIVDKLNDMEEEMEEESLNEEEEVEYLEEEGEDVEYLEDEFNIKKEIEDPNAETVEYYEITDQDVIDKYTCKYCNLNFDLKKDHFNHLKTHKTSKILKLSCHLCDKKFKDQEIFEGHLKVHNGLPAYSCSYCDKTFNFKNNYQTHLLLHTNERPYPCNLCEKSFRSKWDLTMHIRVHNNIRKYECNICNKKFRVSSHMTAHHYTHFSKSFQCDICLHTYISPRTLKQHKATVHSDDKPYPCINDGCSKAFKRKHHLDVSFY